MRKRNKILTALLTVIMVLPFFLGLGSGSTAFAAEGDATLQTQTVTLHKREYDQLPEVTENTGKEMSDFGGDALNGAIFTAYDVSATYWAAYDATEGDDAVKTAAAHDAALNATLGEGIEFPATEGDGVASADLATKSGGRPAIYLFKETTSPAGVVQSQSAKFIVGLPVYDEKTGAALDVVHIYPKNEVKDVDFGFTKYGVDEEGEVAVLPGAKFVLKDATTLKYYDETDNAFTADEDGATEIASGDKGTVTVKDLTLNPGTYEFYEVATVDGYHDVANDLVVTVTVDNNMNVTYNYTDVDRESEEGSDTAKVYNYMVPTPTKTADDKDVNVNEDITFTITQEIPKDIADYTEFSLVDEYDANLELVSTVTEIQNQVTAFGGTVTTDEEGSSFTVAFNVADLKDKAGQTITFTVKMAVKEGAELAADINNEVTFDNNFDDKKAKDSVQTFGKSFLKVDADTQNPLAGAVFNVYNPAGQVLGTKDGKQVWGTEGDTDFTPLAVTSGANGEFSVAGLAKTDAEGTNITYKLKEIAAPDGYVLATGTFDFVADDATATLPINNKHKGSLPSTGGTGIVAFVLIGVIAVGGAALYFTKGRRQIEG